jgi:hypothetical protein
LHLLIPCSRGGVFRGGLLLLLLELLLELLQGLLLCIEIS